MAQQILKICSGAGSEAAMTVRWGTSRWGTGRRRGALAVAVAIVSLLALSACGTPPWEVAASASSSPRAGGTTAGTPRPTPSPSAGAVGGDLASGAASRTLRAGDLTVDVRYWSTLPMDDWTPGADKPLSMSVTTRSSGGIGEVRLVRAAVDVSYRSRSGADVAEVPPPAAQGNGQGYAVAAPQSWSGTFVLGAAPAGAARLRAIVTLVFAETSTGPTAQQTATDTLSIDLAPAR